MTDTVLADGAHSAEDASLESQRAGFLQDVLAGLSRPQKSLPPKYFYDAAGSELFEAICRTPEYYPTRVETALLTEAAPQIARAIPFGAALVEFGSGASDKTRLLLDAAPQVRLYVPVDISAAALAPAAARIAAAYPQLVVAPVEADFTRPMRQPEVARAPVAIGFFPGSTIGNFTPEEAAAFLEKAHDLLGRGALFLIGADLIKDPAVLEAAYDDAGGVTARFNLNLLVRINRELDGDFDLSRFVHRACWNAEASRMEMHLESRADQTVHVAKRSFDFRAGETIHTENSHKFDPAGFRIMAEWAGWALQEQWISPVQPFALFLLRARR